MKTIRHGVEFIHAGSWLPIFHPEVWYVHNELRSQHDIKDSVSIVGDIMAKEALKEEQRIWHKGDEANKQR